MCVFLFFGLLVCLFLFIQASQTKGKETNGPSSDSDLCITANLIMFLPPQGFRPEGEIPRKHASNSRVH